MATVTIDVNGRSYSVGCEDGQEAHVASLARQYDAQVREVSAAVGQVGELRLFLMAALLAAVPLMLGGGYGAELRQPLGISIVGGLIASQLLTLFTTPVIYLAFDRLARRLPADHLNAEGETA